MGLPIPTTVKTLAPESRTGVGRPRQQHERQAQSQPTGRSRDDIGRLVESSRSDTLSQVETVSCLGTGRQADSELARRIARSELTNQPARST